MPVVEIPLTNQPNQSLIISLPQDTGNLTIGLSVSWNRIAGYWQMDIDDAAGNRLLTGLPLLNNDGVYGDLLAQYQYLGLGTMFVFPYVDGNKNSPGLEDWGANFALVWGS